MKLPLSTLQKNRLQYQPKFPSLLQDLAILSSKESSKKSSVSSSLQKAFPCTKNLKSLSFSKSSKKSKSTPLKVGVVLSGGQAPGGHNVIIGLFDSLKKLHSKNDLIGFLGGPSGLIENKFIKLTKENISLYRNQGGFDLIGSGRTKIETEEQFKKVLETVKKQKLQGLVIIGGDDSNTNAAFLAEFFLNNQVDISVVGVPKTIDGDLKNENIEISFGFDTACKTYSATIGSILRDVISAKKYYFFIRLMGRSASHIALECALQTKVNFTLIGEEIAKKKETLEELTKQIADMITKRSNKGKNFGVVLIPEGIIEFIPEVSALINELNVFLAKNEKKLGLIQEEKEKLSFIEKSLSKASKKCFSVLPKEIQLQLLLDRDPHGNVQVAKIESERLFIQMVLEELKKRKEKKTYQGKFSSQPLYLGYEGRSCLPSNFDANYCYSLGMVTSLIISQKKTGYMACLKNLSKPVEKWKPFGIPIIEMIVSEIRKGKEKLVIKKALVDLKGKPFSFFQKNRDTWMMEDHYTDPGPIQFFGPQEISDSLTQTLTLESS